MSYQILLSYIPTLIDLLNQKCEELSELRSKIRDCDKKNDEVTKLRSEIVDLKKQLEEIRMIENKVNRGNTCVEILNKVLIQDRTPEINRLTMEIDNNVGRDIVSQRLLKDRLALEIFTSKLDRINYEQIIRNKCNKFNFI